MQKLLGIVWCLFKTVMPIEQTNLFSKRFTFSFPNYCGREVTRKAVPELLWCYQEQVIIYQEQVIIYRDQRQGWGQKAVFMQQSVTSSKH